MTTHRKNQPRINRLRRRRERRQRLFAKGLNPDDFFVNGIYIGKKEQ